MLYSTDDLYKHYTDGSMWYITSTVTDIYIAIANKSKDEIRKALSLFFCGLVSFALNTIFLYYIYNQHILTGNEVFFIINNNLRFKTSYWIITLLNDLPAK